MKWQYVTIAEVAEKITKGTTPTSLGYEFSEQGIPFLRVQNLMNGTVDSNIDTLFISKEVHEALSRSKIQPNDILVSIAGTIGRAAQVPFNAVEMNCNQAVAIIRPTKKIDARYLLHWLGSGEALSQVTQLKVTATISNLSLSQLGSLLIPLPPLEEQKRIAAILDQADALRKARRRAIERLNDLSQSIFYEMFGDPASDSRKWPIGTIGELTAETQYGTSSKASENGVFPILRMGNITQSGEFDFTNLKYIDLATNEIEKYTVRDGDILFNRTNSPELVGKTGVYRGTQTYAYAGYLIRLRTNENAEPEYIGAFLNCPYGKKILRGMCKAIIGMANINAKELQTIPIPIPPVGLQKEFRRKLLEIRSILPAYLEHQNHLEKMFNAFQQQAFRGELDGVREMAEL